MTALQETFREKIYPITDQLEKTLKTLAENPNGSDTGKAQAQQNLKALEAFNHTAAPSIIAAATATASYSNGFGGGPGRSSFSTAERAEPESPATAPERGA